MTRVNILSVGSSHIDIIAAVRKPLYIEILDVFSFATGDAFDNGNIINYKKAKSFIQYAINVFQQRLQSDYQDKDLKIKNICLGLPLSVANIGYGLSRVQNRYWNISVGADEVEQLTEKAYTCVRKVYPSQIHAEVIPRVYYCDKEKIDTDPTGQICKSFSLDYMYAFTDHKCFTLWKNLIAELGLELVDICFESILSTLAVFNEDEKSKGSIFIDIGANITSITVYKKYFIGAYCLDIGSDYITEAIMNTFHFCFQDAEYIKHHYPDIYRDFFSKGNPNARIKYQRMDGKICQLPARMILDLISLKINEISDYIVLMVEHIINLNRLYEMKYEINLNDMIKKNIKNAANIIIDSKIKAYNGVDTTLDDNKIKELKYDLFNTDKNLHFYDEESPYNGALLISGGGSELCSEQHHNELDENNKVFLFKDNIYHKFGNSKKYNLFKKQVYNFKVPTSTDKNLINFNRRISAIGTLSIILGKQKQAEDAFDQFQGIVSRDQTNGQSIY